KLVGPQLLRGVRSDFAQLPVAEPVEQLAFAELAHVEFLQPFEIARRHLKAILRLAQLQLESVGVLLPQHQLSLNSLVLRENGIGENSEKDDQGSHHCV